MLLYRFNTFEAIVALLNHLEIGLALQVGLHDLPAQGFVINKYRSDHASLGIFKVTVKT